MKLYLARHTQTNYNVQRLANADPSVDVHLTAEGIAQAKNLAELLKDAAYEVVFISQLPRTRQTAEIINQYHNKELVVDARLNDNKTGFESKPVQNWHDALDMANNRWSAVFNDGESINDVAKRAQEFIEYLRTQPYTTVLVVTHRIIIQMILGYLEHKSVEEASGFNLVQGTYAEFDL